MENNSDTAGDLCGVQGLIHGNLPEPRPSEWIARHEITWRTMRLALPLTSRALLTIVARARARFTNFFPDFFPLAWERAQLQATCVRVAYGCESCVFRIDRAAFRASRCKSTKFGKTACSNRICWCAKTRPRIRSYNWICWRVLSLWTVRSKPCIVYTRYYIYYNNAQFWLSVFHAILWPDIIENIVMLLNNYY